VNRSLALRPDDRIGLWYNVTSLVALGRHADAIEFLRPLPGNDSMVATCRLFVLARAGAKAEAEALLTRPSRSRPWARQWAGGLIALGRTDEAMALLTAQWFNPYFSTEYLFDPIFDPVRNDPRWVKLMADAGLTEAHARAQAWRKAHPPEKPAR
jgi:hypothetical protein